MFAHEAHAQLDTKNLNVYINGAQILKDVNVRIPKNKITCIIGPSGCGKSTLPPYLQPTERPGGRSEDEWRSEPG